ncbi:RES family NAD+ phosphorylase [Streptosporangium sp. NPDC051022]|uniref:RES family NAD+ phosphorylase n=1 Tax=Streptosporangium sp. NPDC051022 TaxID=3155752 RepID=UPI0034448BE4
MPRQIPPNKHDGHPHRLLLPKGTPLWRVHDRKRPCEAFTPARIHSGLGGGRFDGTVEEEYGHCYLAYEQSTALAECLLRSVLFDDAGPRLLPYETVRGRRLSLVETRRELTLTSLASTPALAAVAQDEWLIQAQPPDYPLTRQWAHWLRRNDPSTAGLDWISRRDLPNRSIVLFEDRCGPLPLAPTPLYVDLDTGEGLNHLNVMLRPYRAHVTSVS